MRTSSTEGCRVAPANGVLTNFASSARDGLGSSTPVSPDIVWKAAQIAPRAAKPKHHHSRPGTVGEGRGKSKEYLAWTNMVRRCEDDDSPNYRFYGGRGIKVCERWRGSYPAFLADVGRAPTRKHSIGRLDGNGDYEPGNVAWQTSLEQSRDRRCSACGRTGHNRATCENHEQQRRTA